MYSRVDSITTDVTVGSESYMYVFQLCGDAYGIPGAGVVQVDKTSKKAVVIGLYTDADVIQGSKTVKHKNLSFI